MYDQLLQHDAHVDTANTTGRIGPMGKHYAIHKTGNTYRVPFSSEEDRGTVPANTYRKFREVWTCGF